MKTIIERGASWTLEETKLLLALWGQDLVQRKATNMKRTKEVYEKISEKFAQIGYDRTPDQVRTRVFNMIAEYRRILKDPSSERVKKCIFFEALDKIYDAKHMDDVKSALDDYEPDFPYSPVHSSERGEESVSDSEATDGNETIYNNSYPSSAATTATTKQNNNSTAPSTSNSNSSSNHTTNDNYNGDSNNNNNNEKESSSGSSNSASGSGGAGAGGSSSSKRIKLESPKSVNQTSSASTSLASTSNVNNSSTADHPSSSSSTATAAAAAAATTTTTTSSSSNSKQSSKSHHYHHQQQVPQAVGTSGSAATPAAGSSSSASSSSSSHRHQSLLLPQATTSSSSSSTGATAGSSTPISKLTTSSSNNTPSYININSTKLPIIRTNQLIGHSNGGETMNLNGTTATRLPTTAAITSHQLYQAPVNTFDVTSSALLIDRMFAHLSRESENMREWIALEKERLALERARKQQEAEREVRRERVLIDTLMRFQEQWLTFLSRLDPRILENTEETPPDLKIPPKEAPASADTSQTSSTQLTNATTTTTTNTTNSTQTQSNNTNIANLPSEAASGKQ